MNEFIEKLIGRLEEEKKEAQRDGSFSFAMGFKVAISIVNQLAEEYKPNMTNCWCVDCDECEHRSEDCLCDISENEEECPLASNNGWIPCNERLPEEDGRYLVTWKEDWGNDRFEYFVFKCEYARGEWSIQEKDKRYNSSVIAWQPLPEPYNQKGE